MATAEARLGADVTVATTDADGPGRLDVPLDRPLTVRGVHYRYFARSLRGEYKFSWPLTRWLRDHVADFDVVHVHALFSYATIPACRLARRAGVPYVLRPLGTLGAWSLAHRGWKKAPYMTLVERRHLRDAAAIVATSTAEADAVARLGYGAKTRIVALGVEVVDDATVAARAAAAVARRRDEADAALRVLFLSRLHPVKGLPMLLEAVGRLRGTPGVELTVAGDGEAAYVAELRSAATEHGIADRVRFIGHVEGAAKSAAFDAADVFVLPSSHENFGISAAEALARGVPVVLTEGVGIAADVGAAGAGVVVAPSAADLADALRRLAAEPEALAAMSQRAVSLARREYSWPRTAERLVALYSEVSARGARGR